MPQSCETFHPYSACVCVVRQINTHIPPKSIVVSVGTGGTRHRERLELASMTSGCKLSEQIMQRGRVAHAPAAEKCTRFLFASEFFTFPGDTQCMQCNGSQSLYL